MCVIVNKIILKRKIMNYDMRVCDMRPVGVRRCTFFLDHSTYDLGYAHYIQRAMS